MLIEYRLEKEKKKEKGGGKEQRREEGRKETSYLGGRESIGFKQN